MRRLCFTSLPQGWVSSQAYLSILMAKVLEGVPDTHFVCDDIICATSGTFEEHLATVELILQRLIAANLRINHKKVSINSPTTDFLGISHRNQMLNIPLA